MFTSFETIKLENAIMLGYNDTYIKKFIIPQTITLNIFRLCIKYGRKNIISVIYDRCPNFLISNIYYILLNCYSNSNICYKNYDILRNTIFYINKYKILLDHNQLIKHNFPMDLLESCIIKPADFVLFCEKAKESRNYKNFYECIKSTLLKLIANRTGLL